MPSLATSSSSSAVHAAVTHPNRVIIPRLDSEPHLNDFLTSAIRSPAAKQMLRVSNFIERYPKDGRPVTEPTVAYLGYTREYFFAAFVCEDKTPGLIRAHMLARDSLGDDDYVEVMLDTFDDQRRAFLFNSNALGIQSDGLWSEQNGADYSFDTVWDTWGKRTPKGYVVLMRIPFASLYFKKADPGESRTWGIVLQRNISHANEQAYWPQIKHSIAGRLTQDIAAEGFRDIEHGKNLQVEPYLLARNLRQINTIDPDDPYFQDKHLQGYGGLDAKFILHNSLVLDTTVNPDFSQVGIDNPAIPNQRFPPYFAEVRPFFIENSSYFQTPISLYYTNNIVKPQYGARLTGKLGPWAMGILGVDDRSPGEAVPPGDPEYNTRAHFYTGRVNRDLGSLSECRDYLCGPRISRLLQSRRRLRLSGPVPESLDLDGAGDYQRNRKRQQLHPGRAVVRVAYLNLQRPVVLPAAGLFQPASQLVGGLQRYLGRIRHRHWVFSPSGCARA